MSQNLTQPEEIDHALREMAEKDMNWDVPISGKKHSSGSPRKDWLGGYISPYRAAHMKPKQDLLEQ